MNNSNSIESYDPINWIEEQDQLKEERMRRIALFLAATISTIVICIIAILLTFHSPH